ncbi:MAG: 50S ribosomal protein L6 [Spirochaetia bacterium]
MSRVGKLPIAIPQGVKVEVSDNTINVEGPKGKLSQEYKPCIEIKIEDNTAVVTRKDESKATRSFHGLYRNLLNNMITGVSKGFQKALLINGVGYRAEMKGKSLMLNLGYSNPIEFMLPEGINVVCETANKVVISGIDKQKVGQIASEIRGLRPPEPYKGKGVKYEDEYVRRKIGKSGIK